MADKYPQKEYAVLAGYAYYTFVHAPQKDDKYGDKYKTDLVLEDADGNPFVYNDLSKSVKTNMLEYAKELGLSLKDATDNIQGRYVSLRSKAEYTIKNKDTGKKEIVERPPIPVVYADKTPVPKDVLIGNGSKVRVQISLKKWENEDGEQVTSAYLERMIVDELVPYVGRTGGDEFDFPHMRGNKASSKTEGNSKEQVGTSNNKKNLMSNEVPFEE